MRYANITFPSGKAQNTRDDYSAPPKSANPKLTRAFFLLRVVEIEGKGKGQICVADIESPWPSSSRSASWPPAWNGWPSAAKARQRANASIVLSPVLPLYRMGVAGDNMIGP